MKMLSQGNKYRNLHPVMLATLSEEADSAKSIALEAVLPKALDAFACE